MSWTDSFSNKLFSETLRLAGFKGGKGSNYAGVEKPSEVNPVRIIYGRPGWIETTPVIVENYRRSPRRVDLVLHYIVSEGIQRVPDAIMLNDWLFAFSEKYREPNKELQNKTLGTIADKSAGSWENEYKVGDEYTGNISYSYKTGWPQGVEITRYSYDPYNNTGSRESTYNQMCGLSHLSFRVDMSGDALNYVSAGAVPSISVLPNGQYLHDPRITKYEDDYLGYINSTQKGRAELGGFAKGWRAHNTGWGQAYIGYERDGLGDTPDNNPALVVLDYMTHEIYGAAIKSGDINLNSFIAEANYSDALSPTYQGGSSQAQFSCDIELSAGEKLRDNLEKILFTCRGGIAWIDGQYHLKIRKAGEPSVFTIIDKHIKRRTSLTFGKRKDRINRLLVTYTDSGMRYKERQLVYPPPSSAQFDAWLAEDGQLLEKEMRFEGVNNIYRAADLAHTLIKESRAGTQVEYECTLELLKVTVGDKVRVTDDKFDNKLFWVTKAVVSFKNRTVKLMLKEQDESAYDTLLHPADIQDEGGIIAPDNTIIASPEGVSFFPEQSSNYEKSGVLSWLAPYWPKPLTYSVEIYKSGGSEPVNSGTSRIGSYAVPYLAPGNYIAEVRSISDSVQSAATQYSFTLSTAEMPLPPITGLRLVGGGTTFYESANFAVDSVPEEPAWLDGFEWKIYSGATLLYTEVTKTPFFTYGLEQNLADGGHRNLRAGVRRKAISGEFGDSSEFAVSHPAPPAPAGLEYHTGVTTFYARWESKSLCKAYIYQAQGEPLDDASKVYEGRDNTFSLNNLQSNTTYYFIAVAHDAFGAGGSSGELVLQTTVDLVPVVKDQLDRLDGDIEIPGSIKSQINTERTERIENETLNAIVQSVLGSAHDTQRAAVESFEIVRRDENSALTLQVGLAISRIGDNEALIFDETRTRADQFGSLASRVELLQAKVDARPVFSSGWEPGLDYDRWSVAAGVLEEELTDIHSGLQSAKLNGEIYAQVSNSTAQEFSGRKITINLQAKSAASTSFNIKFMAGGFDSGWLPLTPESDWSELSVKVDVPEGLSVSGDGEIRIKSSTIVLLDRLVVEPTDAELPLITAEIERISNAQASLTQSFAEESQRLETEFNNKIGLVETTVSSKTNANEVEVIVNNKLVAKGYDGAISGILGEQQSIVNEQGAISERIDEVFAATGMGESSIYDKNFTMADDAALSAVAQSVVAAESKTGAASFNSLKEVFVSESEARAIEANSQAARLNGMAAELKEYKRTAIGYCVDEDGNVTDHETADQCFVYGGAWVTAPLSEAINRIKIELPGGRTASAGSLFQVLETKTGELEARAALQIDVNGRLSGVYLNGSETASALDIVADSFRLRTDNGSKVPLEVVGNKVFMKDVEIGTGTKITDGLVTTGGLLLSENGYVRAGKESFASAVAGLWLGMDSNVGKLHIGNNTNHLKWDGSTLAVAGVLENITFSGRERWVKSPISSALGRSSAFSYTQATYGDGGSTAVSHEVAEFWLPKTTAHSKAQNKIVYDSGFMEVYGMVSFKNSAWTMQYNRQVANGVWGGWKNLPSSPEIIQTWPENEVRIFPMVFAFPLFAKDGGICEDTDTRLMFRLVRTRTNSKIATLNSVRISMKYDNL